MGNLVKPAASEVHLESTFPHHRQRRGDCSRPTSQVSRSHSTSAARRSLPASRTAAVARSTSFRRSKLAVVIDSSISVCAVRSAWSEATCDSSCQRSWLRCSDAVS